MLVKRTDTVDASLCILLSFEFKTHRHFLKLVSLEGELVVTLGLLVHVPQNALVLQHSLIVVLLLGDPVVKGDYLRGGFARGNLDQVIHVESTLQHGKEIIFVAGLATGLSEVGQFVFKF